MSATGRGTARIAHDNYPTPAWAVNGLLALLDTARPGLLWAEPCRGSGSIYDMLPSPKVWTEIRRGSNFLTTPLPADVHVTNPPFDTADEFIAKSLSEARSVWYLLRVGFLGGQERAAWWNNNPYTHLVTLSKRPAFVAVCKTKGCGAKYQLEYKGRCEVCGGIVAPGTDASEYAWFGWDHLGICKIPPGPYWI